MPTTTLHLIRHGEAQDGEPDPSLTSLGRRQAASAGRALRQSEVDLILHSTRRRAVQSALVIASSLDSASTQASDLFEDRTPIPTTWTDVPTGYHRFLRNVPESEADLGALRLAYAVQQISQLESNDRTIVAVTHNFVIGWFVRTVLDAPWWRWIGLNQAHGAITTIRWSQDREPQLVRYNESGHLPDRRPASQI